MINFEDMDIIDILELERKHNAQMAEAKIKRISEKAKMDSFNDQCSLIATISSMESRAIIAGMLR